jgi:hypothetical protein
VCVPPQYWPIGRCGSGCRYGGALDVKRAADLYALGLTLREIGAELGVHWSTVSDQLRRAGVTMRRVAPPSYSVSTQRIPEMRDQGLTSNQIAEQVDMTVSGALEPLPEGPAPQVSTPGPLATGSRRRP